MTQKDPDACESACFATSDGRRPVSARDYLIKSSMIDGLQEARAIQ